MLTYADATEQVMSAAAAAAAAAFAATHARLEQDSTLAIFPAITHTVGACLQPLRKVRARIPDDDDDDEHAGGAEAGAEAEAGGGGGGGGEHVERAYIWPLKQVTYASE